VAVGYGASVAVSAFSSVGAAASTLSGVGVAAGAAILGYVFLPSDVSLYDLNSLVDDGYATTRKLAKRQNEDDGILSDTRVDDGDGTLSDIQRSCDGPRSHT
jgi:hypothetical protein